jgi:hypothetical protein
VNLAILALAANQIVVPFGDGLSVDQRVDLLAREASRGFTRIERTIYRDPALRAEIRRVGFVRGCEAVGLASREVRDRHAAGLSVPLAAAIRRVIPQQAIAETRPVTFLAARLSIYQSRVESELERSAGPQLADLGDDMRRTFLARTRRLPTTTSATDNRIAPRPDIGTALGIGDHWDLDNPLQLAMACSEQRISPALRPTITTGAPQ